MDTARIGMIILEEAARGKSELDVLSATVRRIMIEVATDVLHPSMTEERWLMFLELIEAEVSFRRLLPFATSVVIRVEPSEFAMAFHAIARAFALLEREYDEISSYTKERWPPEVMQEMRHMCEEKGDKIWDALSCEDEFEYNNAQTPAYLDVVHTAQIGLTNEIRMMTYAVEVNDAQEVVRKILRISRGEE